MTMFCPRCGTENSDGSRFCRSCGQALHATTTSEPQVNRGTVGTPGTMPTASSSATGTSPQGGTYGQVEAARPKKKRHPVLVAFLIFLVLIVLAFAAAAIGLIPRFWETLLPKGQSEQTVLDTWSTTEANDGVTVPEGSMTGVDAKSVKSTLESAGFSDVTIEKQCTFDVYGDDERDGKVGSTKIKDGTDLKAGQTLKKDTPIVITELYAPSKSDIKALVADESDIQKRIADDPTWFEGSWRGANVMSAGSNLNNSKCIANTRSDLMPTAVLSAANDTSLSVRANINALLHYHDNSKPRDYSKDDDKLEDIGAIGGTGSFIMGPDEINGNKGLYQEFNDITYKAIDNKGNPIEIEHPVWVALILESDLSGADEDDYPSLVKDIMGDDISTRYDDDDDALEAFRESLRRSDHVWMTLVVGQKHGGENFIEGYRLEREGGSSEPTDANASSGAQVEDGASTSSSSGR